MNLKSIFTKRTVLITLAVVVVVGLGAFLLLNNSSDGSRDHAAVVAGDELSPGERAWLESHADALLDTMASPASAEVLAFLDESTGYAVRGDHGGAQRKVQSIPILFSGPGVRPGRYAGAARMVDIAPTVWALAGQKPVGHDGTVLCAALISSRFCPSPP